MLFWLSCFFVVVSQFFYLPFLLFTLCWVIINVTSMAKGPMQQRIPHDNDAHHMINKKK